MSLTVSHPLLVATTTPGFETFRKEEMRYGRQDREISVRPDRLADDDLRDLIRVATDAKDGKLVRAVEAILLARAGEFAKPVPNFKAFEGVLRAFLKKNIIDGWIYVEAQDGRVYPELVTLVEFEDTNSRGREIARVTLHTSAYGLNREGNSGVIGSRRKSHSFVAQDVARRRVSDILEASGIFKETAALKAEYLASMERHREVVAGKFAKQFRVNGKAFFFEEDDWTRRGEEMLGRRVIHDMEDKDYGPVQTSAESFLFEDDEAAGFVGAIPEHPLVRVFDLKSHDFYWVNSGFMTPYVYDKALRDKLVLPATHRDLLDVLTADLDAFTSDIIEGKSAGNVIMAKGIPGVGKTLTAEVYAELIERPLYLVHSGILGTNAKSIHTGLEMIFARAKRWDVVLCLDEADVFVSKRGNNIELNAIVAEFLRTLEYFAGLMFMTSNRSDDIDDAILSRCAAIIDYEAPPPEDARLIWGVMAAQNKVELDAELVSGLLKLFPAIAPRDIKMLFRLALRVSLSRSEPLSLEVFRRCAMFRAIKMAAA
jgi:hypothetical protein